MANHIHKIQLSLAQEAHRLLSIRDSYTWVEESWTKDILEKIKRDILATDDVCIAALSARDMMTSVRSLYSMEIAELLVGFVVNDWHLGYKTTFDNDWKLLSLRPVCCCPSGCSVRC